MKSDLVVISWWANCLGLACLHNLVTYTRNRNIYVIQVGKTEDQKERFRAHLPSPGGDVQPGVMELPYPSGYPAEDWRVREAVARELLGDHAGLWFIDHDLFVQEDCEGWLQDMDRHLSESNVCLCYAWPKRGHSITNPAFWLSPVRFPPGMPSFASVPYHENPVASQPYAMRQKADVIMPEKDTLIVAMEFLQERGLVYGFPLTERDRVDGGPAPFPACAHLGGLYTFAGEVLPELPDWTARCVQEFTAFYAACPPAWIACEDPVLLQRLAEFQQATARGG
jgi:hypothetical protein